MLEFILILLLVYFGLKIIFRFFGPMIMRWIMKKIGKKMEQKFRQQTGFSQEQTREGETSIHKKPPSRKKPIRPKRKKAKKDEEYIDFEEIE